MTVQQPKTEIMMCYLRNGKRCMSIAMPLNVLYTGSEQKKAIDTICEIAKSLGCVVKMESEYRTMSVIAHIIGSPKAVSVLSNAASGRTAAQPATRMMLDDQ